MDIYPSILESDVNELSQRLVSYAPYFSLYQLDIADGILVPKPTISLDEMQKIVLKSPINTPHHNIEYHLMVTEYLPILEQLTKDAQHMSASIIRALIHLQALQHEYEHLHTQFPFELGIVLSPEDNVINNCEDIKNFPVVQIMTIHPGAQGTPFLPDELKKITQLRENGYKGRIILDGGIQKDSLRMIINQPHLPDAVCPGSYFKHGDIKDRLEELQSIARIATN